MPSKSALGTRFHQLTWAGTQCVKRFFWASDPASSPDEYGYRLYILDSEIICILVRFSSLQLLVAAIMTILGLKVDGPNHPPHFALEPLIRPNILALTPYRCARDDYSTGILLDANENAIGPALPGMSLDRELNGAYGDDKTQTYSFLSDAEISHLNRYPSPTHDDLKNVIAKLRGVPDHNWVFLGVGSDEAIDMLYRVLCIPGKDRVMTCPPTYGMYKVTANVNDIGVLEVPLITEGGKFQLDEEAVSFFL